MINNKSEMNKGFTIVESLVAITILVFAVTGAASAVQTAISSYTFSRDQIIASYLAQEAIEQVRNIRDENTLNAVNWLTGISQGAGDPCYFASGNACIVNSIGSPVLVKCDSGVGHCPVLRQDTVTGFFGYDSSWPLTTFRREIVLTPISVNEISILVTVDWSKGLTNRQFKVIENILNWQ